MPLSSGPPALRAVLGYVSPQSCPLLLTPQTAGRRHFSRRLLSMTRETLSEVKGSVAPAWENLKKAELAALAEREVSGKNWLP